MKKISLLSILLLVSVMMLTSCSSSKHSVQTTSKNKKSGKETTELYRQSDREYNDFLKHNKKKLNSHTLEYIKTYKDVAIKKMVEYKIPASITLAQGILESGSGRSELTRKANNHFGIKCHNDWDGKRVRYDDDRRRECFRKYKDPEGSFNDHSMFLTTRSRYEDLFRLAPDNYRAWAKGLKKAGYATDRKYPQKLIGIIEDYELYRYDEIVLKKNKKKARKEKKYENTISDPVVVSRNHVIVSTGDTLYSIAKNNGTTVEKIKKINKLTSNNIEVGQVLYLE